MRAEVSEVDEVSEVFRLRRRVGGVLLTIERGPSLVGAEARRRRIDAWTFLHGHCRLAGLGH